MRVRTVVGILAAAVPIYRFAVRKAYMSEARVNPGVSRLAELAYHREPETFLEVAERDIQNNPTGVHNPGLGVMVTTNS